MINFDNHNITGMSYNNHTIKKAYGCDGHLVWEYNPPTPFERKWVATYSDSHTESAECDGSSTIASGDINVTDITSIKVGDCVTKIGDRLFRNCKTITSVNISSSVTQLGAYCFTFCTNLTRITCNAVTPPTAGTNALAYISSAVIIYVPAQSVEAYKATSGWSLHANHIQPMP